MLCLFQHTPEPVQCVALYTVFNTQYVMHSCVSELENKRLPRSLSAVVLSWILLLALGWPNFSVCRAHTDKSKLPRAGAGCLMLHCLMMLLTNYDVWWLYNIRFMKQWTTFNFIFFTSCWAAWNGTEDRNWRLGVVWLPLSLPYCTYRDHIQWKPAKAPTNGHIDWIPMHFLIPKWSP